MDLDHCSARLTVLQLLQLQTVYLEHLWRSHRVKWELHLVDSLCKELEEEEPEAEVML